MMGSSHMGAGSMGITSINLAGNNQKKAQTTDDILKQIEASMPSASEANKYKQGELSATLLGRIGQHEAAFGDSHLPRSRLPKVDAGLMDRYQAARRNVLLLGAMKAANAPGPATHRSNKTAASTKPNTAHTDSPFLEAEADAAASAAGSLDSRFTSFNGRGDGRTTDVTPEASELLNAQGSQSSMGSRVSSGRRMRRQVSNRSANSSFAGSTVSGATAYSRHMTRQNSISSGGSGHTLRSDYTGVSRARTWRNHRKTPRKKAQKPKPGRVAVALAEYGQKEDWLSKTLLRHYLASIIQARWRGYQLRKKWSNPENREQIIEQVKAQHSAEEIRQQRLRELQHKLVAHQQKQLAKAAAEAAEAAAAPGGTEGAEGTTPAGAASAGLTLPPIGRSVPAGPRGTAGTKSRAVSAAGRRGTGAASRAPSAGGNAQKLKYLKSVKLAGQSEAYQPDLDDSSTDSGWSDIELEDVASIKFRAVTPPWQKVGEQCSMSKQLRQRTSAAAAAATGKAWPPVDLAGLSIGSADDGVLWSEENRDTNNRLQELRHRRICRKPEPVVLSDSATAAAAASGLLAAGSPSSPAAESLGAAGNISEFPLSGQVVEQILLERYSTKYNRLGVPERMPGRQKWLKHQLAAKEAAQAAAAAAAERGLSGAAVSSYIKSGPASNALDAGAGAVAGVADTDGTMAGDGVQ